MFNLNQGLLCITINSQFMSPGDTEGVIAGPHPEFTKIERIVHFSVGKKLSYYSRDVQNYKKFCYLSNEVPLLGFKKQLRCTA